MSEISERMNQFIKHLGFSNRKFDLSIGAANGFSSKLGVTTKSIGSNFLEEMHHKYPDLNIIWLITGEGEMLLKNINFEKNINSIDKLVDKKIDKKLSNMKSDFKKVLGEMISEEINKTISNSDV